jgi:coenzyme Q-binding protein COQ10
MPSHRERRHLPFTPPQLFDLVADVDRYPEFLPWMVAAHVRRREGNLLWVDMVVGTNGLHRSFASKAVLERPKRIEISSQDPLFERYQQTWTFEAADDGGTIVQFWLDFALGSRLLEAVMEWLLDDASAAMVRAFKHRARQIYGADGRVGTR